MSATGTTPRVLEDAVELVRRQIGIRVRRSPRHLNEVSSVDSFRHFARGYGDDNPLYGEPSYGATSPWGSPIAAPLYPYSAGVMRPVEWTPAERAVMGAGDPLRGIGQYMCGDRWIFARPIRPGDVLHRSQSLSSAELKQSSFGGGTGALVSHRVDWEAEDGAPVAYRFLDFWHADRDRSRSSGKYRNIARVSYSEEELARIDACYEAETIQGATPRSVHDVAVGDELGPIAKGPLAVTDIVAWHVGTGMGDFGVAALKLGYKNRRRVPSFYQKNELGYWDAAMRAHWDQAWAERLGQPAPYDYGVMRSAWLAHVVTNWMGDGAWLWKLSTAVRKFNHIGDTHFVMGVVHQVDTAARRVTIDLTAVNQRGEATCDGRAVVILPPAGGGLAVLPEFDSDEVPEASAP
jgi:acyl dehydratase